MRTKDTFSEVILAKIWSDFEQKRTWNSKSWYCTHTVSHKLHIIDWVQYRWRHEDPIVALHFFTKLKFLSNFAWSCEQHNYWTIDELIDLQEATVQTAAQKFCSQYSHWPESFYGGNIHFVTNGTTHLVLKFRKDSEDSPDEILDALLFDSVFTRRKKVNSRPDGLMLFDKMVADFFSTSALRIQIRKVSYDEQKTALTLQW